MTSWRRAGSEDDDTPDHIVRATAPAQAVTRRAALQRLLDRDVLPADVAARLGDTVDD